MKKTIFKTVFLLSIIVIITLMSVSCAEKTDEIYLNKVKEVVAAIVIDDPESFSDSFNSNISSDEISQKYESYREILGEVNYFRISNVEMSSETATEGEIIFKGTMGLYTEKGNYLINFSHNSDTDLFLTFSITPDINNQLPEMDDLPWSEK